MKYITLALERNDIIMIPEIFQMEKGVMDTNVDLVPVTRGVTNKFWMHLPKDKNKYFTCDITVVGSKSPSSEFCCFEFWKYTI